VGFLFFQTLLCYASVPFRVIVLEIHFSVLHDLFFSKDDDALPSKTKEEYNEQQ
jgi:hypothetical protein